jgi:hypothetical protein
MASELKKMEEMEETSRSPSQSRAQGQESCPSRGLEPRAWTRNLFSSTPPDESREQMLIFGRAPAVLLLPTGARLLSSSPGPSQVATAFP